MKLPELDEVIAFKYKQLEEDGYGAYESPYSLDERLTNLMNKLIEDKGIEKFSDLYYNIVNEYETKIHDLASEFWEM